MSAMENLVKTILRALDVDVEALKTEVIGRVVAFEKNVETLNATLISLHERQQREEKLLLALCEHHSIDTAKIMETANVGDEKSRALTAHGREGLSVSARRNESTNGVADAR